MKDNIGIQFQMSAQTHKYLKALAKEDDRTMRAYITRFLSVELAKAYARMETKKTSSGMLEGDQ